MDFCDNHVRYRLSPEAVMVYNFARKARLKFDSLIGNINTWKKIRLVLLNRVKAHISVVGSHTFEVYLDIVYEASN